jgi:hypothetical protein
VNNGLPVVIRGLTEFTADVFDRYVGQRFGFVPSTGSPAGDPVEMQLVDVMRPREPQRSSGPVVRQFSLLFRSVDGRKLATGLNTMQHEDFEPCEIFLERVQPAYGLPDAIDYEAVFNLRDDHQSGLKGAER